MSLTAALNRRHRDFLIAGIIIKEKDVDNSTDLNTLSLADLTARYNNLVAEESKVEKFRNKAAAINAINETMEKAASVAKDEGEGAAKRAPRKKANPDQKYALAEGCVVEKMQSASARTQVLQFIRDNGPATLGEMEHGGIEKAAGTIAYLLKFCKIVKVA